MLCRIAGGLVEVFLGVSHCFGKNRVAAVRFIHKDMGHGAHQLVNDPTRGYGILACDMLEQAGRPAQAKVS